MEIPIALRFDGKSRLSKTLAKIRERSGNLTPALRDCGEIMQSSIEENFLQEGRFASVGSYRGGRSKWQKLSPVTERAREKKGKWPGKKLQVSGQLAAATTYAVEGNNLIISNNKKYAAIQQLGGKAGRNKKVTLPGRPFIVIQDEDIKDMTENTMSYITKGRT